MTHHQDTRAADQAGAWMIVALLALLVLLTIAVAGVIA